MSTRHIHGLLVFATTLGCCLVLYAQQPTSIVQIGRTPVSATLPISGSVTASGTVTANQGTAAAQANRWPVCLSDGSNCLSPDTQLQHDTALGTVTNVTGGAFFGRASAAAPSNVSADDDAVLLWALRSGALVNQPSYSGALASTGVGAANSSTPRTNDTASGTVGSAPPTQASYVGGVSSGATGGLLVPSTLCDSQGWLDMTTATTTEIAPLVSGRTIYICSVVAMAGGTTTMTFKRGTGTNCGTGTTTISPGFELTAQTGFAMGNGAGVILGAAGAGTVGGATTSGNAVCATSSAGVNLHILIRYAVF